MGGKPKQSQRTKNNVKPSSSGRSAELLNSGKVDTGLVCMGGGKILPALFPTLAAATVDNDLDPEFQMCIKKLNKKDPVTKTKALQELTELINNSKVDDVVAALPSWAHYYKILSIDVDRKVREYTQACHGAVVSACGRRVAPALRQLMPAWLLAQHDAHPPANTLARNSLASTFPDNKLPDVISFCKTEIFAYIAENLTSNADTILTKKIENEEDKATQYNSIVASSLQGLSYMTHRLPAEHEAWLWDTLNEKLLQQNSFWKLSSNNCNQIRAAWYEAIGRIIERFGATFGDKYGSKTTRILMGVANEQNALVAASLWSCLVMLMHNIQAWHTYLDKKELIVKRILDVLENGGWGDARHLAGVLLPLLASLPAPLLTQHFYMQFFNAMLVGLEQKSIMSSKSERQLWITNLAECLRYLSVQQHDFVVEVTTSVHRTWLQKALASEHSEQIRTNLTKHSATKMASLVKYWLKQSQIQNSDKFEPLIRNFWQNIGSIVLTKIDNLSTDSEHIEQTLNGHVLLLQTMKTSFMQENKKQQNIKFETDAETVPVEQDCPKPEVCDTNLSDRYLHNLEILVHNICAYYMSFASEMRTAKAVLPSLLTLIIDFDGKELFMALAKKFNKDSLISFYESVLSVWICDDNMRCKALIDIVFLMLGHMNEDEQTAVTNSFEKLPPRAVEWCLATGVSHPHRRRACVRAWLRGSAADAALLAVCRRDMRAAADPLRNLLLMCFAHHDREELLISPSAVSGVVSAACAALRECAGEGGAECARLEAVCRVCAALCAALLGRAPAAAAALLLELVHLTLRVPRGDSRLSVDTWCELRSSAQDGIAALPAEQRSALLKQLAQLMREPYYTKDEKAELNISSIENLCTVCPYVLTPNSNLPEDLEEMVMFTKELFEVEAGYSFAHHYALRQDCVRCNLNCLFEDEALVQRVVRECDSDADSELSRGDAVWFLNSALLRAAYLRTTCLHGPDHDDDDPAPSWCETLLSHQFFLDEFCKVLYDFMVVLSLNEGYGFWPHHNLIRKGKSKLEQLIEDIVKETPATLRRSILATLTERSARTGLYWAHARVYYVTVTGDGGDHAPAFDNLLHAYSPDMQLEQLQEIITGNGFFHTLQASVWGTRSAREARSVMRAKYLVMVRGVVRSVAAAHAPAPRRFTADLLAHAATCHLDLVVNAYYMHHHIMLFDTDITQHPWHLAVSNASVLDYLTELVQREAWELPPHHWDFINIACCSVVTSVDKSKHAWGTAKVSMVARAALRLFVAIQQFVSTIAEECERRQPADHVAHLPAEWQDIFLPTLHDNLFHIIMHVLEGENRTPTANHIAVLAGLSSCTRHMEWSALPKAAQVDTFALSRVCARAAACLARPDHVAAKFLAHHLLVMLVDPLILEDMAKLSMWSDQTASDGREEYDRPKLALEYFDEQIDYLQDIVNAVVANVELGAGVVEVTAFTDSHSSCVGWLLLLRVSHKLFNRARSTVALHYLEIYRDNNFAEPVLKAALRLLPEEVFAFAEDCTGHAPLPPHYTDMFFHNTPLDTYEPVSSSLVSRLSCGAVCAGVACAAAGARAWAAAAPVSRARALRRLVRACITPTLVKEHFNAVMRAAPNFNNAVVTIYWSTYEVMCVYTVEDRPMELHITLAKDYPIGVATVHAPSILTPCADTNWVALYLAHQNGSVVEAVRMWMQGVEARVENSPVCYICYARLHPATGRLPRVSCHQCRNKFHVACLNKWFHTSVKSSCPLCRAIF